MKKIKQRQVYQRGQGKKIRVIDANPQYLESCIRVAVLDGSNKKTSEEYLNVDTIRRHYDLITPSKK